MLLRLSILSFFAVACAGETAKGHDDSAAGGQDSADTGSSGDDGEDDPIESDSPLANCARLTRMDLDMDGSWDSLNAGIYTAWGAVASFEVDGDADGTIDSTSRYAYDDQLRVVLIESDNNNDGTADYRVTTTWDADGVGLHSQDYDAVGSPERILRQVPTAEGFDLESDTGADGSWESVGHYRADDAGRITRWEQDDGYDGTIDSLQETTYDGEGRTLHIAAVSYASGSSSEVVYTWNADHTEVNIQQTIDGTPKEHRVGQYVEDREVSGTVDRESDGTLDYQWEVEWDCP